MTVATDPRKTGITGGMTLLAASAVAASVTGTVNETTLATVTIPGGAMGLNGGLQIYTVWSNTSSANGKTARIRIGGIGGTAVFAGSTTANVTQHDFRRARNRNSLTSQLWGITAAGGPLGQSGSSPLITTVDMSAAVDIVFTAQLALATETQTLESYEVWLLP